MKELIEKKELHYHEIRCRYCGSDDCMRIKRSAFIKSVLGFLPLKHYRCTRCLHTFYTLK